MKVRNKRETVITDGKEYMIIRVLKERSDQALYQAMQNRKCFLIREFETKEGFEACIDAHERLSRIGIKVPELIACADDYNICVEKYVTGTPIPELIMRGDLPEKFLVQIKDMAEKCESREIVLDYYPTNYIVCGKTLVYTGCKYYERTENNSYEKAGYSFWAKPAELIRCMANGEGNRSNEQ